VFDAAWSSDLLRALETARIAWGEPEQDPRLREIDFGLLEGVAWSDLDPTLQAELVRFADFEPPGGESARAFEDRVFDFVASLGGGDHLVFTHGGVVRALGRRCGVERYPRHGELIVLDWHAHLEIALA
jgi:probable phosphoglycerate mutase